MSRSFRRSGCFFALAALAVASCGLDVVGVTPGTSSGSDATDASTIDRDAGPDRTEVADADASTSDGTIPPTSAVSITVTDLGNAPQTLDLSSEGTLDWVYWAYKGNTSNDVHKAGVTPLIASPYGYDGSFVARATATVNWPITQTWSDGTSPAKGESNWYTYLGGSDDASVTMNAAATTTPRTFTFIAGADDVAAVVEAKLSDATPQQSQVDAVGTWRFVRVAVTYQAAAADRWLEVKWRITGRHSIAGMIAVTSASVK